MEYNKRASMLTTELALINTAIEWDKKLYGEDNIMSYLLSAKKVIENEIKDLEIESEEE